MFSSLKAVAYRVPDLNKAKEWYKTILGKAPLLDSPLVVIFMVGDGVLSLVTADAPASTLVYWGVDDADAARERLLAAGATPLGEGITNAMGGRSVTVIDPFGNIIGLSSRPSQASKQTLEDRPSESALGVALFRAMAARDPHEEIRCGDFLAEKFLSVEFQSVLANPAGCAWIRKQGPGSYEFFIARTAYFDAAIRDALHANVPQIVFLGAGYDSRSWRFRDLISATRLFEVDIASTQQRKRKILGEAGLAAPEALTFVPVDFSRDDLGQALARAGFDKTRQTLFLWEGVMYYLAPEVADQTFALVRANSPAGSVLCFDYMMDAPDMMTRYGVAESDALMRQRYHTEPVRTRVPEGSIGSFLAQRGFSLRDHVTPEEMEKRFLTLRDGSSAGRALAWFSLVRAETV